MNSGSQLFIVGFEGTELTQELKNKLIQLKPAGVIFYDTNIANWEQCHKLIQDLKALLGEDLIICTDQEGGKVERLRLINPSLPSLAALGSFNSEDAIIAHSNLLASSMQELGFNLVLAPCADLAINPHNPIIGTRSLGSNSDQVSQQIQLIIETYHNNGIKACAKHFPGHGSSDLDSHLDLPVIQSQDEELKVFDATIQAKVDAIMVAHLIVKDWDSSLPASLSPYVIQRISFDGLVISDEITMKALSQFGDYNQLSSLLLLAGNNLIIWNSNIDDALKAKEFLDKSHNQGLHTQIKISLQKLKQFNSTQFKRFNLAKTNTSMLEICRHSMIRKTSTQFKLDEKTAILIQKHPKLEQKTIDEVFKLPSFLFPTPQLQELIKPYQKLIIISFQADLKPELQESIQSIYPNHSTSHCSTDIETKSADIELLGTSRVHWEALYEELKS